MEVNTEKGKVMTNSTKNISANISMNSQKLAKVTSFKYLGVPNPVQGWTCSAEICIRIASAMARLNRIWQSNSIRFTSKFKLYKSLVTSILLFGCETWILHADSEKRIQTFKINCLRKLFCISYLEHSKIRTPSGDCQEMDTYIVLACHTP